MSTLIRVVVDDAKLGAIRAGGYAWIQNTPEMTMLPLPLTSETDTDADSDSDAGAGAGVS